MKYFNSLILLFIFTIINQLVGNSISNIRCSPESPILITFGTQVYITFNYLTEEETGVYIFIKPYTEGSITPNSTASGSPLYSTGEGKGISNFSITEGNVTVDQLQIRMYDGNMEMLFEFYIPVEFVFTELSVSNIEFTPSKSSLLLHNEQVNISFDYNTEEAEGVYIFMKPFTNGSLTPYSLFSGSPLYGSGSGNGVSNFTVTEGEVIVDEIQVQMYNSTMNELLAECFIPVDFVFSSLSVSNFGFNPQTPSIKFNENVFITFDYVSAKANGVFIFMKPYSNGELTPNYTASGSPLYGYGSGRGTSNFSVSEQYAEVDQVQIQMYSSDMMDILLEFFIPVNFVFSNYSISNIDLQPSPPAYFPFNQHAKVYFDYTTENGDDIYIFMKPYTDGELTPNYLAGGSPPYPSGEGSGMCNFTITSGDIIVDELCFQIKNSDMSQVLLEFFIPVDFAFGAQVTDLEDELFYSYVSDFRLEQNYPNPFNPSTTIEYRLPEQGYLSLTVYDILGNEINVLRDGYHNKGIYKIIFDTSFLNLSSGVYFYRIETDRFSETKKMILLR